MVRKRTKDTEKHEEAREVSPVEGLEAQLRRALADYQNLQRRAEEERHAIGRFANQALLLELLPIVEHLDQIVVHSPDTEKTSSWFAPLEISLKQLREILQKEGIEIIDPQGQEFDPNQHEAIDMVEGEEDNKVVAVLSKGYKLHDKVIKAARVRVSKKPEQVKNE